MREVAAFVAKVYEFKDVRHIKGNILIVASCCLHRKGNVFVCRFIGNEAEILEDHADRSTIVVERALGKRVYIGRLEKDLAIGGTVFCKKHLEESRLPRSRVPDDGHEFLGAYGESDLVEINHDRSIIPRRFGVRLIKRST